MMDDPSEPRSGVGRPFRRDADQRVTHNDEGGLTTIPLEDVSYYVHGQSVDKIQRRYDQFFGCGCSMETHRSGGQCQQDGCHRISCIHHAHHCDRCFRGLCSACTYSLHEPEHRGLFCDECYDDIRSSLFRKRVYTTLARLLKR